MKDVWPHNIEEARIYQEELRQRIRVAPLSRTPDHVAGCDASYSDGKVIGAVCVYRYPEMEIAQKTVAVRECGFPYVPGYLSFREGEVLMDAIRSLNVSPDILILDGQGIAHPRGMGIASHIGVLLDIPSIGCAKSRLIGTYSEPGREKGEKSDLIVNGKRTGVVLRTRTDIKPVFVSPGHRIDIEGSVDIVLGCTGNFRLPEPIRCAHRLADEKKGRSR